MIDENKKEISNNESLDGELTIEEKIQKYCLGSCPFGTLQSNGTVYCSSYAGICLHGVVESLDPIA